jgi:hypothetical protein
MAIRVRRGTDAQRLTVVLQDGEIAWTTDTQEFYVGDGVTLGGVFIGPSTGAFVPLTRNLTINGVTFDLSADRTWSVGTVTSVGFTAGTGISLAGTNPIIGSGTVTITNSAPDQTVVLTAGTGIGVAGAYPNFTISNTDPTSGVTLASAGGTETLVNDGTGPSLATKGLTAGSGVSLTGTATDITIANTDPGSAVTLASAGGTETLVNDGTGPALATKGLTAGTGISLSSTATDVTVTNSAPDQVVALTAGTGIGITGAYPNFTITNSSPSSGGTVTSVGLALPTEFAISGSPVTGAGTLTGSWNAQSANTVLSGPTSGGAATPTFRALVSGDIPDISATYLTVANAALNYQPLDSDLTTIAGLTPADDDIIQRKAGAWTNRTIAQYYADLQPSVKNDVYFTFLCLYGGATPLADSSVWHFLNSGITPTAGNTDTNNDFNLGYAVTLIAATIITYGNTTAGTAELVTFALRNTTQNTTTTIATTAVNGGSTTVTTNTTITGLNIAIGASDFFTLRITNPVWVTNPVGAIYRVLLTFKRA